MSDRRWAIYVDVEGFAAKWNDTTIQAFRGINALMQGIFWIGDRYYRAPPDRLFAHQFGDAFLILSDFHETALDRAVLVATALLRHLLANGETAKCAIAEGAAAGVVGCYPPEVRAGCDGESVSMGHGLMTVSPVLGSALVNAVHLLKKAPSGPHVVLSKSDASRVTCGAALAPAPEGLAVVDWLRGEPKGLEPLQIAAGFKRHTEGERIAQLDAYLVANASLSPQWKDGVQMYLR